MNKIDIMNKATSLFTSHYVRPSGLRTLCGRLLADHVTQPYSANGMCRACDRLHGLLAQKEI